MRCVTLPMMISRAILDCADAVVVQLQKWILYREVSVLHRGTPDSGQPVFLTIRGDRFGVMNRRGQSVLLRNIIPRWDRSPGHMTRRAE
jgi:hypothetical protein